jgi:hypothetical protein
MKCLYFVKKGDNPKIITFTGEAKSRFSRNFLLLANELCGLSK